MNHRKIFMICIAGTLALSLALPMTVLGAGYPQWTTNGVALRNIAGSDVWAPQIASDGSGGAIVTWFDERSGNRDIYVQRVNAAGAPQWTEDGVALRKIAGSDAMAPKISSDGSGGAIVTWYDQRSGDWDVYAQKVNAVGVPQWTTNGVALQNIAGSHAGDPAITSDGSGGAIVTWVDGRTSDSEIYAQRLNATGTPQWPVNGVPLRNIPGSDAYAPQITSDGSGGAIVTWEDMRLGRRDIGAQKVDAAGTAQWAANGIALRNIAGSNAGDPQITSDGSGGAIVTWHDERSGVGDIYAQMVNAAGTTLWTLNGEALRNLVGSDAWNPTIASDGSGGAIVTWEDQRSGVGDIYAQRVNAAGTSQWTADGAPLRNIAGSNAYNPKITSDGSGGAVVSWQDKRSGDWDIYAQMVNAAGTAQWTTNGVALRKIAASDAWELDITSDGSGGAIVTWRDERSGVGDIYAQRVGEEPRVFTYYLAEGYTGAGFQEYLCIGNAGDTDATADATFMFPDGTTQEESYNVPANSRFTVDVNNAVGTNREVSVQVETTCSSMVVERPMYFNYSGTYPGGHDAVAAPSPMLNWYFAEGTTLPGFDEYITVLNPNATPANLTFRYMVEGEGETVVNGSVGANSRGTFNVREQIGDGKTGVSLKLESDLCVVAERPLYFNYSGLASSNWMGGHCVVGTNSPDSEWYLAEGTTRGGFEEWLCIQNPTDNPITVDATYVLGEGQGDPVAKTYEIPALERRTVSVNNEIGADKDVSTTLTCETPFIAERPLYFNYNGIWPGGHDVLGANDSADTWFFAEGYTGPGFQEWLCIQNSNDTEAEITITYYPEGAVPIVTHHTVAANTRKTVDVNLDAGANISISAKVESTQPVVVERPIYFNYNGWPGGHDVVGSTNGD